MNENILGLKLRKRRNKLGKTQEWVALELETSMKVKVSQPTVNNWENGKSCPSLPQLRALAKILGLKLSYLVSDTDTDTEKLQLMLEEYAERCQRLEKMNDRLMKENEQLRDK
ncbi:helix-turn-helix transcriptional regulator [Runella sp.]|uniref:helix-turn-helix domain-containing protein n=1 Tax=Runella sp. TaxID=1960881 RepID=UPI0030173435